MAVDKRAFLNGASHTIDSLLLLHRTAIAPHHDKAVGKFPAMPGPVPFGEQSPWRGQLLPAAAALGLASTTAIGMIHRIARYASVDRSDAPVPRPPSFAQNDVFVFEIPNLANGRIAVLMDSAN